jgi:hypothetical protein
MLAIMTSDQVVVVRRWRRGQPHPAPIKTLKELSEYAPKKIAREEWLKRGTQRENRGKDEKSAYFQDQGLDPRSMGQ